MSRKYIDLGIKVIEAGSDIEDTGVGLRDIIAAMKSNPDFADKASKVTINHLEQAAIEVEQMQERLEEEKGLDPEEEESEDPNDEATSIAD